MFTKAFVAGDPILGSPGNPPGLALRDCGLRLDERRASLHLNECESLAAHRNKINLSIGCTAAQTENSVTSRQQCCGRNPLRDAPAAVAPNSLFVGRCVGHVPTNPRSSPLRAKSGNSHAGHLDTPVCAREVRNGLVQSAGNSGYAPWIRGERAGAGASGRKPSHVHLPGTRPSRFRRWLRCRAVADLSDNDRTRPPRNRRRRHSGLVGLGLHDAGHWTSWLQGRPAHPAHRCIRIDGRHRHCICPLEHLRRRAADLACGHRKSLGWERQRLRSDRTCDLGSRDRRLQNARACSRGTA